MSDECFERGIATIIFGGLTMEVKDKRYTKYIQYYSDFLPKNLEKLVKKKEIISLIDLGCGDGANLFALKKRNLLKNKKVFAVDIAKERIKKAQAIDIKFRCFVGEACKLSGIIKNNSIDLVITCQVIEHIKDQKKFIREIRKILRRGGYLYLTTVFKKNYGWFFYKNKKRKWVLDPTHIREYQDDNELIPLIEKSGFKLIHNKKILWKFPIIDFFLKRLGFGSNIYQKNKLLKTLRLIKLPILGYYNWEIICQKV